MSGADSALGIDEKRGVEIAIKDQGGTLAGHPIKLKVEDDGCNAEGGQTAATKLAANPNIAIVLGPACSSAATAGAPILWKAGITDIGTATTAPKLTAPDRKPEYDGYMRTVYSDIDQGAPTPSMFMTSSRRRRSSPFTTAAPTRSNWPPSWPTTSRSSAARCCPRRRWRRPMSTCTRCLTRIATEKPDVIYAPVFVAAGAQIAAPVKGDAGPGERSAHRQLGPDGAGPDRGAGDAVVGYKITYPDVSPEAMGKGYPKFVDEYKAGLR